MSEVGLLDFQMQEIISGACVTVTLTVALVLVVLITRKILR